MKLLLSNMKKQNRFLKRIFVLFLLMCIIVQNKQFCIAAFAGQEKSDGGFSIPYGNDLGDYDPTVNGYYAYLPVRYENTTTFVNGDEEIFNDITVPGFVFNNTFFVNIDNFMVITGAQADEVGNSSSTYKISLSVYERHVFLAEGINDVFYILGMGTEICKWLDHGVFELDAAPILLEDDLYIPFMEVMAILQIPFFVNEQGNDQDASSTKKTFLQVERSEKNVYDVMAEVKGNDSAYPFTYADADLNKTKLGAELSTTLHNMLKGDLSDVFKAVCFITGQKYVVQYINDQELSEEFLGYLLNISDEEGSLIDQINMKNAVELEDNILTFVGDKHVNRVTQMYREYLANERQNLTFSLARQKEYRNLEKVCDRYLDKEIAVTKEIDNALTGASIAATSITFLADIVMNYASYRNRDALISNGFETYISERSKIKYSYSVQYMGTGCFNAIKKAFPTTKIKMIGSSLANALWDNLDDVMEIFLMKPNPVLFVYRITSNYIPVYGALLDDMENFKISYFAIPIQFDTGNAAQHCLEYLELSSVDEDTILDGIELTSLYLKTCYVTRDCAIKALRASEDKEEFQDLLSSMRSSNRMIAENLVALSNGYAENRDDTRDLLPARAIESWEDYKTKKNDFYKVIIPLYMKVSGEVRAKVEGEPPVTDAECAILKESEKIGFFKGTDENGKFSVYIPVMEAKERLEGLKSFEDIKLILEISSPSFDDKKKINIEFEPAGQVDIGVVYLNDFNWYEYIRDELLPDQGYVSLETTEKVIGQNWVYPETWDLRKGLLSAQIMDINNDDIEDCILYYVDYVHLTQAGGKPVGYNDPKTTIHVKVLTKNANGVVISSEARQIIYDDSIGFCDVAGGVLKADGVNYIYFECNKHTYYANSSGTLYSFFTFDGSNMCPAFAVGKTGGGSSGIEYGLITYDENGEYTGKNVTSDGQIWYHEDGRYRKEILISDGSGSGGQSGMSLLTSASSSSAGYEAVFDGLYRVMNMTPDYVDLKNGNNAGDTVMPTFRTSENFSQAFWYNCNGSPKGSNGARSMTITLQDYTDLKKHIDEITDNQNF